MSKCVFITGGNCVGKTTLANGIIDHYGGISRYENDVTYLKNSKVALIGEYAEGKKYGGTDTLKDSRGKSCTSKLSETVETALKTSDIVIAEGCCMNTFGLNLTNAMFKANRNVVINLYMPTKEYLERLFRRTEKTRTAKAIKGMTDRVKASMRAARKWESIGVKVVQINTASIGIHEALQISLKEIES